MRKLSIFMLLLLSSICAYAQDDVPVTPEKSKAHSGIEVSPFGLWLYRESPLFKDFTLKTEIGSGYGFEKFIGEKKYSAFVMPTINIEPRWYFWNNKKTFLGKIDGFAALSTRYSPGSYMFKEKTFVTNHQLTFSPMIGFKKNIGKHWQFELGGGLNVPINIGANAHQNQGFGLYPMLRLRIGYKF